MTPPSARMGETFGQRLWTLIRTVGGQMRNTTDVRIFLLETYTVVYSFTASAFHTDKPVISDDPVALVKLALPVITVLVVLLLRNAWAANEERSQLAPVVDVSLAFGLVILLQMTLWEYFPHLVLPRWRATQGSWAGWLFLTELRAMFPPRSDPSGQSPVDIIQSMYPDEIRWRAEELQRQLRRRNTWSYFAAAAIIILFGVCFAQAGATGRIGSVIVIAGSLFIMWRTWHDGSPRSLPAGDGFELFREFCRSELDRQCKLLELIRHSYIGLVIPGLLLVLAGSFVYAYVVLMYVFLFAELLHREAIRLHYEHDEVSFARAAPATPRY